MTTVHTIPVEVACATPRKQLILQLIVPVGTTARQAVELSRLSAQFPDLDFAALTLGIFGEVVADERALKAGDRVEIYRPLQREPREARRVQVARAKVNRAGLKGSNVIRK